MTVITKTPRDGRFAMLATDCRAIFAWTADKEAVALGVFARCPGLKRLFLVGPDGAGGTVPRSPTVRRLDLSSAADRQACLEHDLLFLCEGKVGVYMDPALRSAHPAMGAEIERHVLDLTRRAITAAAFRATRGWHRLANTLLNLDRAANGPAGGRLPMLPRGRPALIVGAGPSLDLNVGELAENREGVTVIACDGALPTLAHHRVLPDLIVSSDDSEKVWRHFAAADGWAAETPVLCPLHAAWPLARHRRGPTIFGRTQSPSDRAVAEHLGGLPLWDAGQCVGHAAFEAARIMGANPIILVGFDLGYRGDRFHPLHMAVPYYHEHPPHVANLLTVPGSDGRPIRTDLSMAMYLHEFERRIATCDAPVWNATEGGALIAGTRPIALKNALRECSASGREDATRFSDAFCAHNAAKRRSGEAGARNLRARLAALADTALADIRAAQASGAPVAHLSRAADGRSDTEAPAFLRRHGEIIDFLSGALDPLAFARFLFAWQDRPATTRERDPVLHEATMGFLQDLAATAGVVQTIARMAGRPRIELALNNLNAMVFASDRGAMELWRPTLDGLDAGGIAMTAFDGDPTDLPRAWTAMKDRRCAIAVALEGAILPAAWGMAGCVCLDLRSDPPNADILTEHWLPGYAVVCLSAANAEAWRRRLPYDRPVCGYEAAARRITMLHGGGKSTPTDWRALIARLAVETHGADFRSPSFDIGGWTALV